MAREIEITNETVYEFLNRINGSHNENTCWEWTGSKTGPNEIYGQFRFNGHRMMAHRFSYSYFIGKIPDGLVIDHLCRNTYCVNPKHLEAVTTAENIARGTSTGAMAVKTGTCHNGHLLTPDTKRKDRNSRRCKECARQYSQKYRQWKKGQGL